MRHRCPLDWSVAAEGEAGLAVDVLRVTHIGAVIALVYGHVYPGSFGVRLRGGGGPSATLELGSDSDLPNSAPKEPGLIWSTTDSGYTAGMGDTTGFLLYLIQSDTDSDTETKCRPNHWLSTQGVPAGPLFHSPSH